MPSLEPKKVHPVSEHWSKDREMVSNALRKVDEVLSQVPRDASIQTKLAAISSLDHFHAGGLEITDRLVDEMELPTDPNMHGIDVGCGMGGPMRRVIQKKLCTVDGIDITPKFVRINKAISEKVGLKERSNVQRGDATKMPYSNSQFDFALTMAVSSNVDDRDAFYRELSRILKPGARLGMLEVVQGPTQGIVLPVPWSRDGSQSTNNLLTPSETSAMCRKYGLSRLKDIDVSSEALQWFEAEINKVDRGQEYSFQPVLSDWPAMGRSQIENLKKGHVQFRIMVFDKEK